MKKAKYLFFDIECSNGHDICSFGYTLISEDMKILAVKDFIINPESKFILAQKGKRPKIELAYPQELFYKQNTFKSYYKTIKSLLCEQNLILVGHSVSSDFYFLKYACERYGLPYLDIKAYDTQMIFKKAFNREHVESLETILEELDFFTVNLTFHKSCDDALATFYVAKEMAWQKDKTLDQLLIEHNDCLVSSEKINAEQKNKEKTKRIKKIVDKSICDDYNS